LSQLFAGRKAVSGVLIGRTVVDAGCGAAGAPGGADRDLLWGAICDPMTFEPQHQKGRQNMFERMRHVAFAAAFSASAVVALPALGAQCLDVQFPDSVKVGSADLVLNGMGIRKATMLAVKVYVAGLYLPAKSSDGATIAAADQPWELTLHFVHSADASDMRDAFDEGFEKAAGDNLDALKARIETLKAQIVDIEDGQVLSYSYDPGTGTVVNVNGKSGAPIEGADFAEALLTISIGPEPPNEDLKTGLLGGACE
jgi:hypothetical protein